MSKEKKTSVQLSNINEAAGSWLRWKESQGHDTQLQSLIDQTDNVSTVPWLGIINRCSFLQEFVIFLLDKKSLHNVLSEFRKNNSKVALCLWLEKTHKTYFN